MATKKSSASSRSRARTTAEAAPPPAPTSDVPLTDRQEEILAADSATSEITAGGTVEADFRMEADGVKSPIKADFDNPESGLIYDPASTIVGPKEPGEVTVGVGETPAQHEAHVQLSGAPIIAERLEKEAGPDGLSTDLIAREQQERAARLEFQRVSGDQPAERIGEGADNLNKVDAREKAAA